MYLKVFLAGYALSCVGEVLIRLFEKNVHFQEDKRDIIVRGVIVVVLIIIALIS